MTKICYECCEILRTRGALLILTVSSCVCMQMVSTPWAGMMCILKATYREGNQTETTDQPETHRSAETEYIDDKHNKQTTHFVKAGLAL